MANTIVSNNRFIDVTGADGSTAIDADYTASVGQLYSIMLIPGGSSDQLVVKDGNAAGPQIMNVTVTATSDEQVMYFHGKSAQPFIDVSACSFSAGARVLMHHEIN